MVSAEQLLKLLEYNLSNQDFDNAIKLLNNVEYREIILTHYPEVIQDVILKHLTEENYHEKPMLYEACEFILKLLAEKCHQQGVLFEFLEIVEGLKGNQDNIFTSVLKALQVIVLKQSEKKSRSLEYVLNSVEDYILELELPDLLKQKFLSEKEEKLLENDDQIRRILMLYLTLDLFNEPITQQITAQVDVERSFKFTRRNVLLCFILRLMGKPFSHLDLSHDDEEKAKTYSREIAEKLVASIIQLQTNVFNLLQFAEERVRWPLKNKIDEDLVNIFNHPEKTPLLQLGILFYLVIAEGIGLEKLPKVYNPVYIFQMGIYLVDVMLQEHEMIVRKGLKLCIKMLDNIHVLLPSDELDIDIYHNFCSNLVKVLLYSPSKRNRQDTLKVLRSFILKFDIAGRYLLIKIILTTSKHKGLTGYLTTMYKDMIFESLVTPSAYISGTNFKILLLNFICKLENGAQCDISESSDQIIAALNFLVGILLRDKGNVTGIKDFLPQLESGYLQELRSALDFSRAHFTAEIERVKLNPIEQHADNSLEILNDDTPIEEITLDKKLQMLHSALTVFDMVDYHLARVNDIINRKD